MVKRSRFSPRLSKLSAVSSAERGGWFQSHGASAESDRTVWHSFSKLGVVVHRRNDPKGDGIGITLSAYESPDFPGVVYRGALLLDRVRIDFPAANKLTREDVLKLLKSGPKVSLMDDKTVWQTYGRTSIYFEFDEHGKFQHLTISVPETR